MTDRNAEFNFFQTLVRQKFEDDLRQMASIPPNAISEVISTDPFGLPEEDMAAIRRRLEFTFSVRQDEGFTVRSDYKPWLKKRDDIDFYFWKRLRRYYIEDDVLPPNVVSRLDLVTDEVLDYCGNPEDLGSWSRRGMVMGHVQSGKTTNYASLICKAADAGYKIIILLAGLTNSLRKQTQERIDETFIGKKSLFGQSHPEYMPIMSYCDGVQRHPAFGTTRDSDFRNAMATQFGVSLDNLKDPIIFVTKKNTSILENLLEWIGHQRNANGGQPIDYPLLLIDDEADNASVNTHKDRGESSAINKVIRKILEQFNRSSYVGYTATPFANIFIDPDTEDEMCGNDLFPRHFIKALDPPNNYVGATRVFSPEGDLRDQMLRLVDDFEDILPLKHKKDHEFDELPPSLLQAIRSFVLARAIRVLRGDGQAHCSMMINVSRFNDVQERVQGLVYAYYSRIGDAIEVNAGLGAIALQDPDIADLKTTFELEFADLEFDFNDVLQALPEASRSIRVSTVNMRGGKLDYDANRKEGLHVIAIGGLALSRGLTLEGLTTSYLLRNSAASDTLMQMARWFGYRRNYEDLCRLYICESSVRHYEYIEDAIEELRGELKRMEMREETPEQFGLKVRRSETGIMITAANKMRTATRVQLAETFASKNVEGFAIVNNEEVNRSNLEAVCDFISHLGAPLCPDDDPDPTGPVAAQISKHLVWRKATGRQVLDLLSRFDFHANQPSLAKIDGEHSLFSDYVSERVRDELATWDVVIPLLDGTKPAAINLEVLRAENFPVLPLRSRNSGKVIWGRDGQSVFKPTGSRNRVKDPDDPKLLLTPEQLLAAKDLSEKSGLRGDRPYCAIRDRPMLVIHLLKIAGPEDVVRDLRIKKHPVVTLGFVMPDTAKEASPRTYEVNAVFRKQLELFEMEEDDDEEAIDA
ncbi:MAG: Z1 domain-containing protein [Erythrobacter sp.]